MTLTQTVLDSDPATGADLVAASAPFRVPESREQLQSNIDLFMAYLVSFVRDPVRRVQWIKLVTQIAADQTDRKGNQYAGLLTAPASVAAHHNYPGGLIVHYMEMLKAAEVLFQTNSPLLPSLDCFDPEDVFVGIFVHDLHKASFNYKVKPDGSGYEYSTHPVTELLNKNQRTSQILAEAGIVLSIQQLNVLYNSEGGYNTDRPKMCTPLAKFIYLLDELSANVYDRIAQNRMYHYKTSIEIEGTSALNPDGIIPE